jgi:PAS domain S-box-containing protein
MRRFSLRQRSLERSFVFSTTLLVVVLIGTTMVLVHYRVAATLQSSVETRGLSLARSIGAVATPYLLSYNYPALQLAAERASNDGGIVYVMIQDKEGKVAGLAGRGLSTGRDTPEPVAPGHFTIAIHRETEEGDVLEVAVPVTVRGVHGSWGTVRVGLSSAPMASQLRQLSLGLLVLGLGLGVGAVLFGRWVAGKITAPLRELSRGTDALAMGDTSYRIPVSGPRELADLAHAFNVMADRLEMKATEAKKLHNALEMLNATLEKQVELRTLELEESEAQYKTLVEHSPDTILIVQGGRLRFVNSAFIETFGVREDEALGKDFEFGMIFEPSSIEPALERIAAWERGETPSPTEVRARDFTGGIRHLELRGSRIEYRGRPAAECLLIDMTEAVQLRERLGQTEKLRSLGELAGGVAHDFNNLLSAILGRAQLLRRRPFDADVDRDLAVIEKAALDGRETVRRVQEFSRVRRDRQYGPLDLSEVMRDAVEMTRTYWQADAQRRNLSIRVTVEAEEVPPILGSEAELREVFTNLILNSVDAMPQGGELMLRCRRQDDRVLAEIEDNGTGMSDDTLRHLFDPFYSTKGTQGIGLGMSVVYGIVTRHDGRIDVSTSLGKGTRPPQTPKRKRREFSSSTMSRTSPICSRRSSPARATLSMSLAAAGRGSSGPARPPTTWSSPISGCPICRAGRLPSRSGPEGPRPPWCSSPAGEPPWTPMRHGHGGSPQSSTSRFRSKS